MADQDEREESESTESESTEDEGTGLVGGGGPAATIDELPGPEDEDVHRADGDHGEL